MPRTSKKKKEDVLARSTLVCGKFVADANKREVFFKKSLTKARLAECKAQAEEMNIPGKTWKMDNSKVCTQSIALYSIICLHLIIL
jgi:hypothetical protein